jgi:uncharacterized protein YcbK (DUF882 family)
MHYKPLLQDELLEYDDINLIENATRDFKTKSNTTDLGFMDSVLKTDTSNQDELKTDSNKEQDMLLDSPNPLSEIAINKHILTGDELFKTDTKQTNSKQIDNKQTNSKQIDTKQVDIKIDEDHLVPITFNFNPKVIEEYKRKWKFIIPTDKLRKDELVNLKYTQPITQKFYYDFKNYMAKKGIDIKIGNQGGFRDLSTQKAILKRGASKTLRSHHREGRALDIVVANYDPNHDRKFWGINSRIANEMRRFARSHPVYSKYVRFLNPKWDPNHIEFRTPQYWARKRKRRKIS